ncbi:MAG: hypothetical protein RIS09_722 [Actinomycetota bacterium]
MIFQSSAEVTAWPERIALTVGFIGVMAFLYFAMYRNWKRKSKRDEMIQEPDSLPILKPLGEFEGTYIATTYASDWLKRVHAHDLALPSRGAILLYQDGLGLRLSKNSFFIPKSNIVELTSAHALAGKVFEADGIVAITWRLGDVEVVTGFRTQQSEDHAAVVSSWSFSG